MDQPAENFYNNKCSQNGSISAYGGREVLTVQVASSTPGACAINGAGTNLVYGNGKTEKQKQQHRTTESVRYRECLKNHAASIGSHAVDGCGEFMPRGSEGSEDAMKCMACGCHRNFHRREAEGEEALAPRPPVPYGTYRANVLSGPYGMGNLLLSVAGSGTGMEQLTAAAGEEEGGEGQRRAALAGKKRFRTKFTAEQKEKMLSLAEQIGWRIQKHDEAAVQRFCEEVGVRRHVLKVWMHNNKNNLAKNS